MSVDISPPVDATTVTLGAPNIDEDAAVQIASGASHDEPSDTTSERREAPPESQHDTIEKLSAARDLNRLRARRLIARLRQLEAGPAPQSSAEAAESVDQYVSRLIVRDESAGDETNKADKAARERARLAAMRELSQWNAKRHLDTHFRRNFLQATLSKGAIAPLALMAGLGLLVSSRSAWPSDIYPALLCFAVAAIWGGRYLFAVLAPLRHRLFMRRLDRTDSGDPAQALGPANASAVTPNPDGYDPRAETHTVADLLAELQSISVAEPSNG